MYQLCAQKNIHRWGQQVWKGYVDDLLKLLDNEKEAIKLIKDVKEMCASGGFKLTKFLSNSKEVSQSIDEADKRQGVTDT